MQEPKGKLAVALGRNRNLYNPSQKDMKRWAMVARAQLSRHRAGFRGAVHMHVDAFFAHKKAHFDEEGNLTAEAPRYHTETPDADNISKFIGDCLTGMAYADDCQCYHTSCTKRWTQGESRTVVTLNYETK
jgi:Holliday junction resolvase RusA-like endonuclease